MMTTAKTNSPPKAPKQNWNGWLVLDKPIGLQELREFQGVVSSCPHAHGTFTTTSTYTPEALQFARENGIEVVDGRGLLRRILTRTRQSQQALLAVAYHGR